MFDYKGYTGHAELDADAGVFHGEVLDLRDVVTFEGQSVDELERAFRDSVDDYLDFCAERSEEPDKPFTGRLSLRVPSALHRRLAQEAMRARKSLSRPVRQREARTCCLRARKIFS